jgi:hypothetical protein
MALSLIEVIPGRVNDANPEPKNTGLRGKAAAAAELHLHTTVFIGSGFAAAQRPGMT